MSQPDPNPYEASPFADPVTPEPRRQGPGPISIVISVVFGLLIAVVMFCVSFFFTCLGLSSMSGSQFGEFDLMIVYGVAGFTALASFAFTAWGTLKVLGLFRR